MIHRIRIRNTFKHPDTELNFEQGLTGIYGANESGKSMILEMIAFALFGSVALRGNAADYKKLDVEMEFSVDAKRYTIVRGGNKAMLHRGDTELATGHKPVNAEMLRILGYDYKVFCIANYSPQGELLQLGRMKPAERKAMVDNVIGLGVIDKVIASIADQMRDLNGRVQGLDAALVEPEQPVRPDDYRPKDQLDAEITSLSTKSARYYFLDQWLKQPQRTAPDPLEQPPYESEEALREKVTELTQKETRLHELDRQLLSYVETSYTHEALDAMSATWAQVHRRSEIDNKLMSMAHDPGFTKEQLDAWKTQAEQHQRWLVKKSLESQGQNECPKCQHTWFFAAAQLSAYDDAVEVALPPRLTSAADYAAVANYEKQKSERAILDLERAPLATITPPPLSMSEIAIQKAAIDGAQKMRGTAEERNKIADWLKQPRPAYQGMLQAWSAYNQMKARNDQLKIEYENWLKEYGSNFVEFEGLAGVPAALASCRELLQRVAIYDHNFTAWRVAHARWQEQSAMANELRFELSQMEKGREAMRGLRIAVKKFLVPSLNRVASYLLAQMTGGARSMIAIDEEFEITVDGQPLQTLSGSGQSVANLAIRIALGQVLIAKKFPVFMADEIDGDMDDARAEFTADCLKRLTKHVPQLLLISHKRPVADHLIELGVKNG